VDLIDPLDLVWMARIKRERAHSEARVLVRLPSEDAVLELNVSDAPMVLGGDGDQDKMQNGEGSLVASTESSSSPGMSRRSRWRSSRHRRALAMGGYADSLCY
jgi:hypothetical protein